MGLIGVDVRDVPQAPTRGRSFVRMELTLVAAYADELSALPDTYHDDINGCVAGYLTKVLRAHGVTGVDAVYHRYDLLPEAKARKPRGRR